MLDLKLTKEEYEFINLQRSNMEALAHTPPLDIKNMSSSWLLKMQPIHQRIFGGPRPNIGCGECIRTMLRKFYPKVKEYERDNANQ